MNIEKMMKDLQRMQSKLQGEIETLEVEATSGGGLVTARMSGKKDLLALTLSPEAITPDDPGMLQDLKVDPQDAGLSRRPQDPRALVTGPAR